MPRKNVIRQIPPRPGFGQITAHLVANSDTDYIDTRKQSDEYLTLQKLSDNLHSEIDRQKSGILLRTILTRLSSACDNLLESCRRAKNAGYEDDPAAFRTAMRDAERNAREFDRELKNFAQNDNIDLAMIFGEDDIRRQAYGMWIEDGEYTVNQADQKYLNALSDAQPNLNQQQGNSANEPPKKEGQPESNGNQQPVQEENPNPAANQIPPEGENANAGQRAQAIISPEVYRAAAYAAQADKEAYGNDLTDLKAFLDGLATEKARLAGLPGEAAHLQELSQLSEAGLEAFSQIIRAREAADSGENKAAGREALDRAARTLGTFEQQYRQYREKYPKDIEQISGMGNYNDRFEEIDLKIGGTVLEKIGYEPPKPLFPVDLAPEQIIAAFADEMKTGETPQDGLVGQLEQFGNSFRTEGKRSDRNPQITANARMMAEKADELYRAVYNVNVFMQNGEPEQARESMKKAVESLRRFERTYEAYQRYDGENQQRIAGTSIQNIGRHSYEGGNNYLELMGYEAQPAKEGGLPAYVPAAPRQENLRGIPYEKIATSLATGRWENGEFNPSGELSRITRWLQNTKNAVYPLDARYAMERTAAVHLINAADKMVKSCLELNKNESPENLQQAAKDAAEFDRMLLLFQEMHPDFALGKTICSGIDPIWNESQFDQGAELLERIKKVPEPSIPEKPEIIPPEPEPRTPVMPFRRSKVNSIQLTADYMAEESNRRLLKAFSKELDRQVQRLEQTGENPELYSDLIHLSTKVDSFLDSIREARITHDSPYTTLKEDLNALIDASSSAEDLEEELDSFMKKHPAALAENGRRFAQRWSSDPYLSGPNLLKDIGRKRSALAFIEEVQNTLKTVPKLDKKEALTEILVTRQLSGAVRGKTKNLKITRLSEGELAAANKQKMSDPMFRRFLDAIPEERAMQLAGRGHGGAYEAAYKQFELYVFDNQNFRISSYKERGGLTATDLEIAEREEDLMQDGERKTAAKWIEDAQRIIKNSRSTEETDRQIARILAARQLAEAERGNRENLDKTHLYESQINARAEALLNEPEPNVFRRFLSTMKDALLYNIDPENSQRYRREGLDDILAGHGGRLEDKLTLYAHSIADGGKLNHKLYQRYKPVEYRSYQDYFNKMANPRYLAEDRGDVRNDQLRLRNCQRMFTAFKLGSESLNPRFDRNDFEETYKGVGSDPMFKLMTMNSERASLLNRGDHEGVMNTMQTIVSDFTPASEGQKLTRQQAKLVQRTVSDLYTELTGGRKGEDLDKFLSGRSREYRNMVYQAKNFMKKYEVPNAEDAMMVFTSVLDYQKGKEEERSTPSGIRSFNVSMKLAKAVVQGTAAEKYLKEQIDYVNQKRGLAEGAESPKRIRFEDIPSALDQRKEREAAAALEAQQNSAQNNGPQAGN